MKSGFGTGVAPGAGEPTRAVSFTPPSVADLARLFPHLEILELLGHGGMGAVYKARQPALDRLVALKILPPQLGSDPGFAERFTREARALARLTHSNIVSVHDFGKAGDFHYLIMEFVDGANLRQIEQAGKLTPREALRIVPQICEALQFAHDEGIVHRDIKPENILVNKRGRVKIADFGIAKILGTVGDATLTGAKDVVGTPHYMAPEQVESPQTVDHRADIYSLGVVFYEMLTGELPLGKFQPPSRKVEVDVRLDKVVLHALEKEPERRYQHASEVKTDIETISADPGKSEVRGAKAEGRSAPRLIDWSGGVRAWLILFVLLAAAVVFGWFASDKSFSLPASLAATFAVTSVAIFFGVWLLSAVRGLLSPVAAPAPTGVSPAEQDRMRGEVKGPAIGLVVTAIANWVAIPVTFLVLTGMLAGRGRSDRWLVLVPLAALVLSSVMMIAGLKMKRLEAYGLAIVGSILAILISPGNLIGLPLGIWALVVLSRREVRAAFAASQLPAGSSGIWKVATVLVVMLVLCVLALFRDISPLAVQPAGLPNPFGPELTAHNEGVPPVVIETVPEAGSSGVDPALTEIRISFSHRMQDGSWSWVKCDEQTFPEMPGQPRYLADERTCVLPVKLQPGKVYAIWLNSDEGMNFRDTAGRPAVPYLLIFETRKVTEVTKALTHANHEAVP